MFDEATTCQENKLLLGLFAKKNKEIFLVVDFLITLMFSSSHT